MKTMIATCEKCNREFSYLRKQSWRPKRRFCSNECRHSIVMVACEYCRKEFHIKPSNLKRNKNNFCSPSCHYAWRKKNTVNYSGIGEKSHLWKGGEKITSEGYIEVYKPEHPRALKQSGRSAYVKKHILIVEKFTGRYVSLKEVVHHLDNNKLNNNPGNLYLFTTAGKHTAYHHAFKRGEIGILKSNIL